MIAVGRESRKLKMGMRLDDFIWGHPIALVLPRDVADLDVGTRDHGSTGVIDVPGQGSVRVAAKDCDHDSPGLAVAGFVAFPVCGS